MKNTKDREIIYANSIKGIFNSFKKSNKTRDSTHHQRIIFTHLLRIK